MHIWRGRRPVNFAPNTRSRFKMFLLNFKPRRVKGDCDKTLKPNFALSAPTCKNYERIGEMSESIFYIQHIPNFWCTFGGEGRCTGWEIKLKFFFRPIFRHPPSLGIDYKWI